MTSCGRLGGVAGTAVPAWVPCAARTSCGTEDASVLLTCALGPSCPGTFVLLWPAAAAPASASTSILRVPFSGSLGWGGEAAVPRAFVSGKTARETWSMIKRAAQWIPQISGVQERAGPVWSAARKSVATLGCSVCARQLLHALQSRSRAAVSAAFGRAGGLDGISSLTRCTPATSGPSSGPSPHAAHEPSRRTPSSMGYRCRMWMPAICALWAAAAPHVGHRLPCTLARKASSQRGGSPAVAHCEQLIQWM